MHKAIEVRLMKEAAEFTDSLDEGARKKVFFNITKTIQGLRGEWFEKMSGSGDLYEFRTLYNRQYIRLFAFWDTRDNKRTLIICTHGLIKKTAKTPAAEIEKAKQHKKEYFS
jgi:phage-related protein